MESNPCGGIQLLGIAHPVKGKLFYVQGVFEKTALTRGRFEKKADMWLDIYFVEHVLELLILIYVCIKSDVTTLKTIVI